MSDKPSPEPFALWTKYLRYAERVFSRTTVSPHQPAENGENICQRALRVLRPTDSCFALAMATHRLNQTSCIIATMFNTHSLRTVQRDEFVGH
jgi:hypothetical protein